MNDKFKVAFTPPKVLGMAGKEIEIRGHKTPVNPEAVKVTFEEQDNKAIMKFLDEWRKEIKAAPKPKNNLPVKIVKGGFQLCDEVDATHMLIGCSLEFIDEVSIEDIVAIRKSK